MARSRSREQSSQQSHHAPRHQAPLQSPRPPSRDRSDLGSATPDLPRPAPRRTRPGRRRASDAPRAGVTIGAYLIQRLQDYGVHHVFGIPGDYVIGFYDQLSRSAIKVVGTAKEDGAGFAADAYARVNGIGAVCVTYCVGGLSVANAVAGAYAEKSPVVVISGSPGIRERVDDPLLHHKVKTFSTQKEIFEKITVAAVVLDDLERAFRDIDEALRECWRQKRPVYIEIPRDMVDAQPRHPHVRTTPDAVTDPQTLAEALAEAVAALNRAKRPVILADVEVHRHGLAIELTRLTERTGIPVAATILGKSVMSELHPNYLGIYEGALGRPEVREAVEGSDCLLMLGTFLTDVNLGVFTARLDRGCAIEATSERIQISRHRYDGIAFGDFMRALANADIRRRKPPRRALPTRAAITAQPGPLRASRVFELIDERLEDHMAVVCDVGLCLFGAMDLVIHRKTEFLAPAYYTSMGFAVPGALGVGCASRQLRPVVLVGDGAFQMTGMELTSIVRRKLDPIVIVFNNRGYTTERFIKDGPYNDLNDWRYEQVPLVLGAGWGAAVTDERGFIAAWDHARGNRGSFSILNVLLDPMDAVPALKRLGERLAENLAEPRR